MALNSGACLSCVKHAFDIVALHVQVCFLSIIHFSCLAFENSKSKTKKQCFICEFYEPDSCTWETVGVWGRCDILNDQNILFKWSFLANIINQIMDIWRFVTHYDIHIGNSKSECINVAFYLTVYKLILHGFKGV